MKVFHGVFLVAACLVACTHSYPGVPRDTSSSDESDEREGKKGTDTVLVLPPESQQFGGGVIDLSDTSDFNDGFEDFPRTSFFNPFGRDVADPFDGFLTRMQDVMRRFRERIAGYMNNYNLSSIFEQGAMPWDKIPPGANSTSSTKIINGHVVTINETTFMNGDDENGILVRVRIFDVEPQNETIPLTESEAEAVATTTLATGTTEEESTTPSRSVETVEEIDNEIPKNQVQVLTA